jgi:hypothetical protein
MIVNILSDNLNGKIVIPATDVDEDALLMAAIDNDVSNIELVEEDEEGTSVVYSINGTVRRRKDVSVLLDQGVSSATTRTSRVGGPVEKMSFFSNRPYDQSKYSDPLIYVPI